MIHMGNYFQTQSINSIKPLLYAQLTMVNTYLCVLNNSMNPKDRHMILFHNGPLSKPNTMDRSLQIETSLSLCKLQESKL